MNNDTEARAKFINDKSEEEVEIMKQEKEKRIEQQKKLNKDYINPGVKANLEFVIKTQGSTLLECGINPDEQVARMLHNAIHYIETGETKWTDKNVEAILKPKLNKEKLLYWLNNNIEKGLDHGLLKIIIEKIEQGQFDK